MAVVWWVYVCKYLHKFVSFYGLCWMTFIKLPTSTSNGHILIIKHKIICEIKNLVKYVLKGLALLFKCMFNICVKLCMLFVWQRLWKVCTQAEGRHFFHSYRHSTWFQLWGMFCCSSGCTAYQTEHDLWCHKVQNKYS